MEQKYFWYLFCGTSAYGSHNLTVGFDEKDQITELDLAHVKEDLISRAVKYFENDELGDDKIDVAITSINYLGHMSDSEFLNNG